MKNSLWRYLNVQYFIVAQSLGHWKPRAPQRVTDKCVWPWLQEVVYPRDNGTYYAGIEDKVYMKEPYVQADQADRPGTSSKWRFVSFCSGMAPPPNLDNEMIKNQLQDWLVQRPTQDISAIVVKQPWNPTLPLEEEALAYEDTLRSRNFLDARNDMRVRSVDMVESVDVSRQDRLEFDNTRRLVRILPESVFMSLIPFPGSTHIAFSYVNLLKAVTAFPSVCQSMMAGEEASSALCRRLIATFLTFTEFSTHGLQSAAANVSEFKFGVCAIPDDIPWSIIYPCDDTRNDYRSRGALGMQWSHNYGAFSSDLFGDPVFLLENPELVEESWLAFASGLYLFLRPRPDGLSFARLLFEAKSDDDGFGSVQQLFDKNNSRDQVLWRSRKRRFREIMTTLGQSYFREDSDYLKEMNATVPIYWARGPDSRFFRKCILTTTPTPFVFWRRGDFGKCVDWYYRSVVLDKIGEKVLVINGSRQA